jgi:mannose/fructose/N-acetylgalactosamine-specific phosphotransferase system component IIB
MDERLVHAQILYHWCKAEPIEEIWVLSLTTMSDPFKKMLIEAMVPASLKLKWLLGIQDITERHNQCRAKDKVLIVVETLEALYAIVENCSDTTGVISNMLAKKERAKTILGLYMTRDEMSFAEQYFARNSRYHYQPLPDFEAQELTDNNLKYEEEQHEHVIFTFTDRSIDA